MISRQDARFLRQRAERLREIAGTHPAPLSSQLRRMADELDKRADELEKTDRSPD
jgi:DICT domain-containing protein